MTFWHPATSAKPELPTVRSTDPVMIQYTSGTTGFPKGALLHHRGLVNNGAHTADRAGIADGAVQVTTMPLFHTGGCVCCVIGAVSRRATQVLVEAFDPGLVIELMQRYRCNAMLGVPTMLVAMMEHPSFASADLSSVRAIYSGGSTVPAAIVTALEQQLGAPFTIVFGQTECSPVALMTWATDTIADKAGTIGTPMPNVEVKIVNPDTGQTVPIGEIGEICTRGYHIMHGYFENEAATKAAIDPEGWLHTGDLGAMDARGYCTIEGRLKDMIIRGGENIYPRELEEALFRASRRRRRGRHRTAGRQMGRSGRGVHPAAAGRDRRQGRAVQLSARASRPAQDSAPLVRRRCHAADRIGQDPEVQAARAMGPGRDEGALKIGCGRGTASPSDRPFQFLSHEIDQGADLGRWARAAGKTAWTSTGASL